VSKKYIISVLIPSLLIHLCGCYSMKEITKDEYNERVGKGDIIIYTNDSTFYFFEEFNYKISNDSLFGNGYIKYNEDSDFEELFEGAIALTNIEMIEQDELNPVTTTLLIIVIVAPLVLFALILNAINESFK